jgi:AcrR family transcriptional regulator
MGRYRVGIETRRRIVDATRSLLAEAGMQGTTIKAICARADTLPGSFYNLFDSKEEAVLTVVREAIQAVDPDPAGAGTDTVDDLVGAYVKFVENQPELARIYLQIAVRGAVTDEHLAGRVRRHRARRVERFADAILRETPDRSTLRARSRAILVLATLDGLVLSRVLDPSFDFASHARDLLDGRL